MARSVEAGGPARGMQRGAAKAPACSAADRCLELAPHHKCIEVRWCKCGMLGAGLVAQACVGAPASEGDPNWGATGVLVGGKGQ